MRLLPRPSGWGARRVAQTGQVPRTRGLPRTALLVASSGGHLQELHLLRPRLPVEEVLWATFDDPHAQSLLSGERVHHLHWTGQRDYRNVARNVPGALAILRRDPVDLVVSTGAAVALSVLGPARALGLPCHYIESAARLTGPSMTGRLLERVPGVRLHSQSPWPRRRWRNGGSVFDGFAGSEEAGEAAVRRVVVTLGTSRQWAFRRAVERLRHVIPPEAEVVWQTGHTDTSGLGIDAVRFLSADELDRAMREADVVVAHAGVGSALAALEAGHRPVLLPRRPAFRENVDDHQRLIADELGRRGLAVPADASTVTLAHLQQAAGRRAVRAAAPAFSLE